MQVAGHPLSQLGACKRRARRHMLLFLLLLLLLLQPPNAAMNLPPGLRAAWHAHLSFIGRNIGGITNQIFTTVTPGKRSKKIATLSGNPTDIL
jgi:hypothetical protein